MALRTQRAELTVFPFTLLAKMKLSIRITLIILMKTLIFSMNRHMTMKMPNVVVVGAGWAGWGAARALCNNGCSVTLVESNLGDYVPNVTLKTLKQMLNAI